MGEDRFWCLTARGAPVVLVVVRYQGEQRWTHLLRWNYDTGELEPGAWTTMHVKVHRCRLSRDGRFLCYLAEGAVDGPFDPIYGGAWAISRAPWLAALTNTYPAGYIAGGESRDALSQAEQDELWAAVPPPDRGAFPWAYMLGPGWDQPVPDRFVALQPIGDSGWIARATHASAGAFIQSPFNGELRYEVLAGRTGQPLGDIDPSFHAASIRWAQPLPGHRLATIDAGGRLELRRFPGGGPPETTARHELAGRPPPPGGGAPGGPAGRGAGEVDRAESPGSGGGESGN
jgi:hypothetical protein